MERRKLKETIKRETTRSELCDAREERRSRNFLIIYTRINLKAFIEADASKLDLHSIAKHRSLAISSSQVT